MINGLIVNVPRKVEGVVGQILSVNCQTIGSSPGKPTWYNSKGQALPSGAVGATSGIHNLFGALRFASPDLNDSGTYICKVEDKLNNRTMQGSVEVEFRG